MAARVLFGRALCSFLAAQLTTVSLDIYLYTKHNNNSLSSLVNGYLPNLATLTILKMCTVWLNRNVLDSMYKKTCNNSNMALVRSCLIATARYNVGHIIMTATLCSLIRRLSNRRTNCLIVNSSDHIIYV